MSTNRRNIADTTVRSCTSVLVANRGEIARRIFRTATEMGMRTVAVYVEADAGSAFVEEADVAVALGRDGQPGSYMDVAAVLDAAARSGADAVHPGYGFLSENADFAQAVIDAGLIWIGPSPDVISRMGDKVAAKQIAQATNVPTLSFTEDAAQATSMGFPLLIKAAARWCSR